VTHPNVCRVFDLGEVDGHHCISMEYVDGEDLGSLLKRIGHLPKDKAIQVARQICAGVAAAHEQGILHRDLKPANIMIDGQGRVRITDFGLAGLVEELRRQREIAGTPAYMAPEQLDGRGASVRSDLYALGLVLYQVFTGKPAFEADSVAAMAELQRSATPTSPSNIIEGFDPAVERVILKCIEKDPALRPGSALSIAAALPGGDPLAAALAAGETPSPELVAAAGESEAMHPGLALALAALIVVLFAAGARLNGRHTLRAWAPLDKPPAAQVDRARDIIRELGYTEDVYSDPVDTAIGYSIWGQQIDWIEEHDTSADRWEQLRQVRPGVASFWYRQSPGPLIPRSRFGSFVGAPVGRWNPFPDRTGEILVSLDASGRLELFAQRPRHYFE
jgi:serine/threonine-protein kinase